MLSSRSLQAIFGILLLAAGLFAHNPPTQETTRDFLITKWTTEDGLPQNTVTSLLQTIDGYLWLGTFGGLARFDGTEFEVYDSANTPAFRNNRVLSLFEDARGTLWIGTESGAVYLLADKKFSEFSSSLPLTRRFVWGIAGDREGRVYIASSSGLEEYSYDPSDRSAPPVGRTLSRLHSSGLTTDDRGRTWVRISGRYYAVEDGELVDSEEKGLKLGSDVLRIRFGSDGRVLAGGFVSMSVHQKGLVRNILRLEPAVHNTGYAIAADRGRFWFQQADELFEINGFDPTRHDLSSVVSGGSRDIITDSEGNLWIGTQGDGLVRVSKRRATTLGDLTGLNPAGFNAILEDPEGSVWIAGPDLIRVRGNDVQTIGTDSKGRTLPLLKSLALGPENELILGSEEGLFRAANGIPEKLDQFGTVNVHALFLDSTKRLWIGTANGLKLHDGGEIKSFGVSDGLVHESVHYVTETADGTIWIGTKGGISRFRDGRFSSITVSDGLSGAAVRDILQDEDGAVWIATYGGGISRIKDGKVSAITRADGIPNNFVSRIISDYAGFLWFLTNDGIFRADIDGLNKVADGLETSLIVTRFGIDEGMPVTEGNGGHQPAGTRTKDGKIWFPMLRDVVIIDPTTLGGEAPRVLIEGVRNRTGGGMNPLAVPVSGPLSLSVEDARELQIEYTALSLTKPENLRFFYRLDGLENDWIDAGDRRSALYPYLPAGDYTFHVKAVSWSGVWSENTGTVSISVSPRFWETNAFLILSSLIIVAIVIGLFRYRTLRHRKSAAEQRDFAQQLMNAHESERKRISAELHDSLGQNLLLIKNWASMAETQGPSDPEVAKYLSNISGAADVAIAETRSIVRNLGPQHLRRFGLTEAVANMVEQIEEVAGIRFEKKLEDIDGLFEEDAEISIYRILQECFNNIVKHSGSDRGAIYVSRNGNAVDFQITDYGKGLGGSPTSGVQKGLGLQGLAQRVSLLGGELRIDSPPGEGTSVRIRLRINEDQ